LALSGCTVREIAAITGHSPRDVEAILEAPYLGGRMENCPKYAGSPWRCLPGSNILTTPSMAISRSLLGARRTCSLGSARWESAASVLTCWR
jgi:hypothetical protein